MSKPAIKFLIYTGCGFVVAFLVMWMQGVFAAETTADVLRIVCDGFFVTGALFLLFGGLIWTYNGGVLDGLGYSFKQGINRIRRNYTEEKVTFAEYREKREAKATSPRHWLLSGLVHIVIAIILMVVYSSVAG